MPRRRSFSASFLPLRGNPRSGPSSEANVFIYSPKSRTHFRLFRIRPKFGSASEVSKQLQSKLFVSVSCFCRLRYCGETRPRVRVGTKSAERQTTLLFLVMGCKSSNVSADNRCTFENEKRCFVVAVNFV